MQTNSPSMYTHRVIVLGSVNVDLVIRSGRLPRPGETVVGGEFYRAYGGKGANQAVAAARSSAEPVLFIAAIGDDAFGREARAELAREKLICDHIKIVPGQPCGVAIIMVDERGENAISVASGANQHLLPADVDAIPQEVFTSAKVFITSMESPLETVARCLARARQAGLLTILNPAPSTRELVDRKLLQWVDVLTPNEGEATVLTGCDALVDAGAASAALELVRLGCRSVVITRGSHGCLVVDDRTTQIDGCSVQTVDTTAAGDAFNGAMAVALAEGHSLIDAARWANCAAAISVTRLGAQPSLAKRSEIDSFGAELGVKRPRSSRS